MDQYLIIISNAIGIVSFLVMIYGALISIIVFIRNEIKRATKTFDINNLNIIRQNFGFYLLLGLEFLIAADIIHTILEPTLQELSILGGIVIIRILLSYFINLEIENVQKIKD